MIAQLPSELLSLQLPLRIRIGDAQAFDLGPDPQVTMVIRDPSLLTEITHPSLDALGKAYVEKRLDIEGPISQVIGIGDALSEALGEPDGGAPPVRESHDKDTDAEAIHYHYDLSNDFYQLWLDPEMVYSCAYFETGKEDLATAQLAKLRHLCRKLRLQPGEKLLDVGCGWGGLARLAAREFGVEVTGITLSKEQLALGRKRVKAEGLEDRITLKLLDYRDLPRDGRFDKVLDAAAGNRLGYLRFTGNHAQSDDYEDGAGNTVPSRWKKWNGDVAVGWTPDEDTLIELTAGKGDGEARYAGRGMDGSQFKRESLGLRFVKSNVSDVLEKVEAQVYYNYADHIMDNFRLRTPDPSSMMPMPMASQVDRRTLGGRLAATWRWDDFKLVTGVDAMRNEHRARGSKYDMMTDYYTDADQFPWSKDAVFHNYGAFGELTWFAAERDRLIGGLRLDRASVKDYRQTLKSGHMGHAMANPTANDTRADTLPSGFVRYEHDLADSPTTLYAGLGHAERFPDYWELFSPKRGPNGSVNAFDKIKPEKTTQLDFGLQYNGDKLQAWASGYVGVVQDFILFSYREGMMGSSTQATNVDARIMGGELGASYQLTGNWKTDASLAYAWGKNSSDDRALPQIPPLEARFGLTYEEGDWSAGSLWRVVAPQNRIARDQGNVVGKDFDKSAGFGVFSLNGAYRVTRNVKLSAGVDNLFDKDYTEHLNKAGDAGFGFSANETVPEPGRTFWTKVDFSF
nr:TonB-dependent copper receptor [Pseudomonas aeruginosa]